MHILCVWLHAAAPVCLLHQRLADAAAGTDGAGGAVCGALVVSVPCALVVPARVPGVFCLAFTRGQQQPTHPMFFQNVFSIHRKAPNKTTSGNQQTCSQPCAGLISVYREEKAVAAR